MEAYTQSIENQIKFDLENPYSLGKKKGEKKSTSVFGLTEEELVEYLGHVTQFLRNEVSRQCNNFYDTPVRKLEHSIRTIGDIVEMQRTVLFCLGEKQGRTALIPKEEVQS